MERLKKQIGFIREIDKVKNIIRRNPNLSSGRMENDAEHAWHLSMMAIILSEYSNEAIDLLKVIKMTLIHDLVEIDAGDVYLYDKKGNQGKLEREIAAAERIFSLLPDDTGDELRALWFEFEERETPEARFAAALDRLEPVLQNVTSGGKSWIKNNISYDTVLNTNAHVKEGSEALWEYLKGLLDDAKSRGLFPE